MSKHLTAEEARELLQYNPATGLFRWRVPRGHRKPGWFRGIRHNLGYLCVSDTLQVMDLEIGIRHNLGYLCVSVNGRKHLAHRVAWLMTHGEWPEHQIDHINHCKTDNRLCNLRHVTNKENHMNRIGKGYTKVGDRFKAQIVIDGATKNLGTYDTAEEARAAYLKKKAELFPIGEVA
jgi:hypothetical protein